MTSFFPFRYDRRLSPMWLPFGTRPGGDDGVRVDDDGLQVDYGWLHLRTPLENVSGAHAAGPYRWHTAVGARLSFVDDGLTFGTNRDRGVCIHFVEPVPRVIGFKPHSALTVTVEDCDGLVAALGELRVGD